MAATVFIPHHHGREMLIRTLETLLDGSSADFEVVVVDNGSNDGSVEGLRERFPRVEIEPMGRNLGFGPALNAAIASRPEADPVILLNNDVHCQPGFVAALLAAAADDSEMVAGVLLQDDRPERIDSAGVVVEGDTLMAFDYLHGEDVASLETAPAPLGPCGGAALFQRTAFDAVGGFDERIFVYYEDADLALRMRVAGFSCALAPAARALHAYSATFGSRSARKYEMTGWSRGYLLRAYGVGSSPLRLARAVVCEAALCAGQLARDRTVAGLRGRLRGWRDGATVQRRTAPSGLLDLSVRERLRLRAKRRR